MEHVFILLVYLGTGEYRYLASGDLYFRSAIECNHFAKLSAKRYGNYSYSDFIDQKDRVTSYCVPKFIKKGSVKVY